MAAAQALQQELPARQPDEIPSLLAHFRRWFRGLPNPSTIEDLTDGVLDIAAELFDDSVLGNLTDFRRQWLVVVNDLYPTGQQFNWAGTNWVQTRNWVRAR